MAIDRQMSMTQDMTIKPTFSILLSILAWDVARAHEGACATPPYGASMDAYNVFVTETQLSGEAQRAGAQDLSPEVAEVLTKICKMKYEAADRTELYRLGFTPEDIERSSTVMLTSEYLAVMKYVAFQKAVHGQEAPKPDAPLPTTSDYQAVSVRDFAADGPRLAAKNAKVSLTGSYILQGNRGMLYADIQAIVITKYRPEAGPQPNVPLLTDHASRQLRQRLLTCQSDLSAAQVGCTIKIRGQARMCPLTDAEGATHDVPCVDAEEGK